MGFKTTWVLISSDSKQYFLNCSMPTSPSCIEYKDCFNYWRHYKYLREFLNDSTVESKSLLGYPYFSIDQSARHFCCVRCIPNMIDLELWAHGPVTLLTYWTYFTPTLVYYNIKSDQNISPSVGFYHCQC